MDLQKIAHEIGLFETACNLEKVERNIFIDTGHEFDANAIAADSMPLPGPDIRERTRAAARWLRNSGKSRLMFLAPETALIEQLTARPPEVIQVIPASMDEETRERVCRNIPAGADVSQLQEPFFPTDFFPANGMIVITGYLAGERLMVPADTWRLVEHYSGFRGRFVFVPYAELPAAHRCEGWMELDADRVSTIWRYESCSE